MSHLRTKLSNRILDVLPVILPAHEKRLIGPAEIARFRSTANIYLSPHFDDICFSLGSFAQQIGQGILINLFTHGTHVANGPMNSRARVSSNENHLVRAAEDHAFATAVGLQSFDLALEEPSLRGRGSRDLSGLEDDCRQLVDALLSCLFSAVHDLTPEQPFNIFCPAGIGNHTNHVATMMVARHELVRLSKPHNIFFYEEFPYSASARWRRVGLKRLFLAFPGSRPVRWAAPISNLARKAELIRGYRSQVTGEIVDLSKYSFSSRSVGTHEALWEFAS